MKAHIKIANMEITLDESVTLDPSVEAFVGTLTEAIRDMTPKSEERQAKKDQEEQSAEDEQSE